MTPDSKIYVAGHRGLAGSAILRRLQKGGYRNLLTRTHAELDLTRQADVEHFFEQQRPEYVFLGAAKVGGIHANNTYPADFIRENLAIETNVIHAAWRAGVKKLLFLGSSCIYPGRAPQPMKEEYLLTGALEPTNAAYAIAKIAGVEMCDAYNRQHGTNFLSLMPTNLYGPGDNYDLQNSHVLPALMRKMHAAKVNGESQVTIWGSGRPRREFLFSDDLADASIFLMERYNTRDIGKVINIGVGEDHTIRDIAAIIAQVVGFNGTFEFDTSKPDGSPQKLLDVSAITTLGWRATTSLSEGLAKTYADFLARDVARAT